MLMKFKLAKGFGREGKVGVRELATRFANR